ncbi:MAG: hypothetical protein H6925_06530 [Holosporaceae bacterium]|nr:MAG: hypothetical protein H6925_06530 [Holosporaceae bacterium]
MYYIPKNDTLTHKIIRRARDTINSSSNIWYHCFYVFCWLISEDRKSVNYKQAFSNLLMQGVVAAILLHIPFARKN